MFLQHENTYCKFYYEGCFLGSQSKKKYSSKYVRCHNSDIRKVTQPCLLVQIQQ